jgi:RND family efflux transporter MFP subunit
MTEKMYLRNIGFILLLIAGLLLTGCSRAAQTRDEAPLVRTQTIKLDGMDQSASYAGEVRGRYESQLAFQVSGKIVRRNVELGSVVKPGDALMEIDAKDIQQTVVITSAQVDSAQSQFNLAESNLNRYRQLYEQNAISRAQLDQYQNAYDAAAAAVRQALAQYAQGSNQLGYSTLYADSAGVISAISAEAGQVVSAGQTVVTLVQDGEREVEINVPENRVEEVRQAGTIRLSFWALPDVSVTGAVREIAPVADKTTRTYKVRVTLINPPPEIKLGMTAKAQVANQNARKSAYIPLAAIYQTGNQPGVWVVANGAVTLRTVKTGSFGDGTVEVLEGLQDDDVIVTAGVHKLAEGQKVRAGEGL